MGCAKSKSGVDLDLPLPPIDLTGLDGPSKFEAMLPFKRFKIETIEKKLKDGTGESKTLSLDKLREIFNDQVWADLKKDDSLITKVVTSETFKDGADISRDALLVYALILSVGDSKVKARVFYDILQDNNQEFISANDKDFVGSFNLFIDLATKVLYEHLHHAVGESPKIAPADFSKIDDVKETISEGFLDDVFGAASKLTRKEWETKVASTQKWLFDSKQVRARVEKEVGV